MTPAPKKANSRNVDDYLASLKRTKGAESGYLLGGSEITPIDVIPSRIVSLDAALGVGGLPRGRVVEIYGPESSGKTSLALHFAAQAERLGGLVHYIDAEHALDAAYAVKLGIDPDKTIISQPDNGEQALGFAEFAVQSELVTLVVIDSVAALVPQSEIDGEMGAPQMGIQARLMSQAMRKLTGAMSKSNTTVIFINQIRMKIGVMFGNPETTTGGNALKFYASIRLDVRAAAKNKDGENIIGHKMRIKVVKNKLAPPFKEAEVDLVYGVGFDLIGSAVDLAIERKVIEQAGAWFSINGERIQGRQGLMEYLRSHNDIYEGMLVNIKSARV